MLLFDSLIHLHVTTCLQLIQIIPVEGMCILIFFSPPLSLSVCTLSSQICEWHVSLHLALTCIAYGHCIMAWALVMQHPSTTRACEEVTRGRETNCLCKSIKKTKQLQPHLFTLWEDEGEKQNSFSLKSKKNMQ